MTGIFWSFLRWRIRRRSTRQFVTRCRIEMVIQELEAERERALSTSTLIARLRAAA